MYDVEAFNKLNEKMSSSNKIDMVAIFNKISGSFIGTVYGDETDDVDTKYFSFKKIKMNPKTEEYVGDFETGEVKNVLDTKPIIYEEDLNSDIGNKILSEVQFHKQINILSDVVYEMIIEGKVSKETKSKFIGIRNTIKTNIEENNKLKDIYKNSPNHEFVSKQETEVLKNTQTVGGLNNIIRDELVKGESY